MGSRAQREIAGCSRIDRAVATRLPPLRHAQPAAGTTVGA
jgi:hypothetical protein